MRFIIVTGLSGAGKTTVIHYLEDMGFFCIDNLPPKLMPKFAELCYQTEGKIDKVAVVVDIRGGKFFDDLSECLDIMKMSGFDYEILFLTASDETLIKRYKESRRMHPLSKNGRTIQGINIERNRLMHLKEIATLTIDTSNLQSRQLREVLKELVLEENGFGNFIINVISFGFKHGALLDADTVFDVRFLPNPYYIEDLKYHTGKEKVIQNYLLDFSETQTFLGKLNDLLEFLMPLYIKEGKSQLIIGIGCTGGMHRSVFIADSISDKLRKDGYRVITEHRDINKVSESQW